MNSAILLFISFILGAANGDNIVHTTSGPIIGSTLPSGKVTAFLGIPYAEPPVGELRFRKPIAKASWEDVYDATHLPSACIQANFGEEAYYAPDGRTMNEDCLYLNIWVPQSQSKSQLKPIIVYFHGGAFMIGSSNMKVYGGASLAEYGDIVVATINYRLGGLGFFTGFTDDAQGNMGLYDQLAAIQWIKENAESFQGDPNNIVLMGQSAGAFSVSAHLISPLSKDLFRRAILLSGSILHPAYSDNNKRLSKLCQEYASDLGCATDGKTLDNDAKNIIECLKNVPAEKFSEADAKLWHLEEIPGDFFSQILFPRIGEDFLPESTIDSFRRGHFKDTDILLGITRDEGSILLTAFITDFFGIFGEKDTTSFFNETTTREFIKDFVNTGCETEDDKIIQSYIDRVNGEEGYSYLNAVSDAYGDFIITCGVVFQADMYSLKNNPVHFYMFDYRPPSTVLAKWMGVAHFEEVPYVFGNPIHGDFTEYEKEFSQDIIGMLAAFAKTGNPNIRGSVTWPRYTYEDPKYFVIGKQDRVETKPDLNRCEVWRKFYGSVIDDNLIQSLKNAAA